MKQVALHSIIVKFVISSKIVAESCSRCEICSIL